MVTQRFPALGKGLVELKAGTQRFVETAEQQLGEGVIE